VLGYHPRGEKSLTFDTDSGRGRLWWFKRSPAKRAGWATKYRGTWYAIWHDGDRDVFQAGSRQIPITGAYRCTNERVGHQHRFALRDRERDEVVFELVFAMNDTRDPKFDHLDCELENLLALAAKTYDRR